MFLILMKKSISGTSVVVSNRLFCFPFGVVGEPAFFYTALLFLDFSDGPEGAECEYSEQG